MAYYRRAAPHRRATSATLERDRDALERRETTAADTGKPEREMGVSKWSELDCCDVGRTS